jgi:hypothetical protein
VVSLAAYSITPDDHIGKWEPKSVVNRPRTSNVTAGAEGFASTGADNDTAELGIAPLLE